MSFSFVKKDDRLEAKTGNMTSVRAILYDRYGNIAYNANGYSLDMKIPVSLMKYASLQKTSGDFTQ